MKKFRNPEMKIFEFTKEDIVTVSVTEPGAGLEGGGTLLSTNPELSREVNIGTITK